MILVLYVERQSRRMGAGRIVAWERLGCSSCTCGVLAAVLLWLLPWLVPEEVDPSKQLPANCKGGCGLSSDDLLIRRQLDVLDSRNEVAWNIWPVPAVDTQTLAAAQPLSSEYHGRRRLCHDYSVIEVRHSPVRISILDAPSIYMGHRSGL